MSFAKVYSAQTSLLKAHLIDIEVDLIKGLHSFSVVGLPDKAVEESRDRVSAAIKNSGFPSPKKKNQKVVIALAPAQLKKEGPIFDLGIALAYLLAVKLINFDTEKKMFLGELSLNGDLRKISGVLPLVLKAKELGFEEIYVPKDNAIEAGLIDGIKIFGANSLKEIIDHLNKEIKTEINPQEKTEIFYKELESILDFSDIKGQETAKRGLEIAAAGGHNITMYGPPGTGKSMLAKAFCNILPRLDFDEILEVTSIHSVAGALAEDLVTNPPFRSPHHTSSYVSMVGGGTIPKPGEVTLAHRGVLFLDEFPEFDRRVVESLRQPLEDRIINISRAKGSATFPANFILVAAMNPCRCGNFGTEKECVCSPIQLENYRKRISGPIVDRVDMWVEVSKIDYEKLSARGIGGESEKIRRRVEEARKIQKERFGREKIKGVKINSDMSSRDVTNLLDLSAETRNVLNKSAERLGMSARSYHRVLKLARTIADLENSEKIKTPHILEALQYRPRMYSSQ